MDLTQILEFSCRSTTTVTGIDRDGEGACCWLAARPRSTGAPAVRPETA